MAFDEKLAERVRALLRERDAGFEEQRMMGSLCFMVNGKMCVGVEKDRVLARIAPAIYETARGRRGCIPMDFTGKSMRGFVFVDPEGTKLKRDLNAWLELALEFNPREVKASVSCVCRYFVPLLVAISDQPVQGTVAFNYNTWDDFRALNSSDERTPNGPMVKVDKIVLVENFMFRAQPGFSTPPICESVQEFVSVKLISWSPQGLNQTQRPQQGTACFTTPRELSHIKIGWSLVRQECLFIRRERGQHFFVRNSFLVGFATVFECLQHDYTKRERAKCNFGLLTERCMLRARQDRKIGAKRNAAFSQYRNRSLPSLSRFCVHVTASICHTTKHIAIFAAA
jgi:hypothetical protein